MTKKNETLKIDFDSYISISESIVDSDPRCQDALGMHNKLFEKLKENYSIDIALEEDAVVSSIETEVREAVYKRAFEAGMRFILNTIAGREVIEI